MSRNTNKTLLFEVDHQCLQSTKTNLDSQISPSKFQLQNRNYLYYESTKNMLDFLYQHTHVSNAKPFETNSANCSFSTLVVSSNPKQYATALFLKAVNYPKSPDVDDIVVDNINGALINQIIVNGPLSKYRNHVMKYVDAFYNETCTNRNAKGERMNIPSCVLYPKAEGPIHCEVAKARLFSIFECIDGTSLYKLQHNEFMKIVLKNNPICRFFDFLIEMGVDYGMLHNDLHLGNVFFDHANECLTMIDYGRIHFGYGDSLTNEKWIPEILKKNLEPNPNVTYRDYMDRNHDFIKSRVKIYGKFPMAIFDMMTLSGNLAIKIARAQNVYSYNLPFITLLLDKKREWSGVQLNISTFESSYRTIKITYNDVYGYIAEGLFYLGSYIIFMCRNIGKGDVIIDRSTLQKFIHTCFQPINVPQSVMENFVRSLYEKWSNSENRFHSCVFDRVQGHEDEASEDMELGSYRSSQEMDWELSESPSPRYKSDSNRNSEAMSWRPSESPSPRYERGKGVWGGAIANFRQKSERDYFGPQGQGARIMKPVRTSSSMRRIREGVTEEELLQNMIPGPEIEQMKAPRPVSENPTRRQQSKSKK